MPERRRGFRESINLVSATYRYQLEATDADRRPASDRKDRWSRRQDLGHAVPEMTELAMAD